METTIVARLNKIYLLLTIYINKIMIVSYNLNYGMGKSNSHTRLGKTLSLTPSPHYSRR